MKNVLICLIAPIVAIAVVGLALAVAPPGQEIVVAGSGSFNGAPIEVAFANEAVFPSPNECFALQTETTALMTLTAVIDTGQESHGVYNTAAEMNVAHTWAVCSESATVMANEMEVEPAVSDTGPRNAFVVLASAESTNQEKSVGTFKADIRLAGRAGIFADAALMVG